MILIQRNSNDPYFNIAAEEYFLKNYTDDIIMFWQSTASVIIGKHQNTMSEVNMNFVNQNNIPVIRRITGGGTVYHDGGNINYTIITSSKNKEQLVDFRSFTKPMIDFLYSIGLTAVFEGKNNLTIGGKKISGNSAHVYKNRILNHGTILFNTDLDNLEEAINPGDYYIADKAVQSVRATVTNIQEQLQVPLSIEVFIEKLTIFFIKYFNISSIQNITDGDSKRIAHLVETKYKLWDWNYGYSPSYNFSREYNGIKLSLEIKKGLIADISIIGNIELKELICNHLLNHPHKKENIENYLKSQNLNITTFNIYMYLFGLGDM